MTSINWNLLQPVDIGGQFTQGFERGRSMAREQAVESALRDYTLDPSEPMDEKAVGVLARYAPERLAGLERIRHNRTAQLLAQKEEERRRSIFGKYGSDPAGARSEAVASADIEALKVIDQLDDGRKQLADGAALLEETNPTDQASYEQTLALAKQAGINIAEAPPEYNPQWIAGIKHLGAVLNKPKAAAPGSIQKNAEYYRSIGRDDLADEYLERNAEGPPLVVDNGDGTKTIIPRAELGGGRSPKAAPSKPAPSNLPPPNIAGAKTLGSQYGTVTSTVRSPEHNKAVGGVKNSYHLSGRAIDIARKPGVSHAEVEAGFKAAGYQIIESLDEGDHSHLALAGGARKIASKAEFDRLPSGAHFIAPDGSMRMKP